MVLLVVSAPRGPAAEPDWWSLEPVHRPAIPHSRFDGLARSPVDSFHLAALEKSGLRPSAPAARLALLRRVTIDLTGLPPAPEEVSAFLTDPSPSAYEQLVDRLLASPAYGERWGRHWLDVVRFGESHGYEQNHLRDNAWPYRDYVIRSFNEDKPYDQFISEQLAGDVLARGNPEVEAATGFLVAGVHDTVGIQTVEGTLQQRANDLDDMVGTIGSAFLGLTVQCAKCHDHKFDPIPQQDYYRLAAVVAGVRHGERVLSSAQLKRYEEEAAAATRRWRLLSGQVADLDGEARTALLHSRGVDPVPRPPVNARRNVEDFAPVRARLVRFTILATRDGAEPCLDELEVFGPGQPEENLALASGGAKASASSLLPGYPIHQIAHVNDGRYGNDRSWISNEHGKGWVQVELPEARTIKRVVWSRDAAVESRYNDRLATDYRVEVSEEGNPWQTVATGTDRARPSEKGPSPWTLLKTMTPAQRERRGRLLTELAERSRQAAISFRPPVAYVGQFTDPDAIFVLKRGDVSRRGPAVTPGGLSQIPGLSAELEIDPRLGEAGRRLALARWVTDPRNPLTARVLVNRLWQYHFGRGLAGTPSDFGLNGEPPSHPELLDWLAGDFVGHGWRLKRLHRLIVTSYAYCQSSAADADGLAKDASNLLLWRMPLRRLEAEAVRDSLLAVGGRLDRRMGGPGFRLFKYRVVNVAIYEPLQEFGPETWRRSVYQQAPRAYRDDLLAAFDCPESAQRAPRRDVTTTPLQALSLLNGVFLVQQADALARRIQGEAGNTPEAQVDGAFRLTLGRESHPVERAAALELVAKQGLSALCRALLNANEFLYY